MLHDLTVISSKKTDLILTVLVDRFLSIHIAEMQCSPRDLQLLVSRGVRSQISSKRPETVSKKRGGDDDLPSNNQGSSGSPT